jgi:hypothetical protein
MSIQVKMHDVAAARKLAGPRNIPVLKYSDGKRHYLMPNGQRINAVQKVKGKSARRLRIKNARFMREHGGQLPAPAQ